MTDIRAQLAAAFAGELAEHLAAIRASLAAVEAGGRADLRDMFRRAHSLKGAARAVDLPETERHAHALEAVLAAVEQGQRALDPATIGEVRAALDAIEDAGGTGDADNEETPDAAAPAADILRVSGMHVERLTRAVGAIADEVRARGAVSDALGGIEAELGAIGTATGAETARRVARAMAAVRQVRRSAEQAQWRLERALAQVEQDAERIMLLPAGTLLDGFERMVRELAEAQGKRVAFRQEGEGADGAEADRRVLQALRDPVMHLLRNAVGHGIELPARRAEAGKREEGIVTVTLAADRGMLRVMVTDDGAGLDYARIEAEARRGGRIAGGAAPARDALRAAVFEHRFSTAGGIDEISGRGVGLDVVAEAVRRLHGSVAIGDRAAGGTEIAITVPLALSRQTLTLFEIGDATFALPAAAVRRVLRLARDALRPADGGEVAMIDGAAVPVIGLGALIGVPATPGEAHHQALLIGEGEAARLFVVDRLTEVRRAIVGDPTAIAAESDIVFGTMLLDDATVALVIDPQAILARARANPGARIAAAARAAPAPRRRTILVVDDSVTTRTLERSILEAQGYRVLQSVDGIDGLERLRASPGEIDLVVADVEMPRMDGFGLLTAIRNDPATANIPVVMMTSRNSPDDIARGLALGANAYATKQDFDQGGLLAIVGQLV
jgi:two-component system chemotaxis sensor kinase CheA